MRLLTREQICYDTFLRLAIRDYVLSWCKPGASTKSLFDAVGLLMTNKIKSQQNIILKEE